MKLLEQMRVGKLLMTSERLVSFGPPCPDGRMVGFDGEWICLRQKTVGRIQRVRAQKGLPVEYVL